MTETVQLLILIALIGVTTLALRATFLFYLPKFINHPRIRRAFDAVPASMLVALVIPFTFFVNQQLSLFRTEVYAILITIPLIYLTKKYAYGLLISIISYIIFINLF